MFCSASNKHTKITHIKQKYSNDNQKARHKIIELQPQIFIYSFQVKLNKTTYLSFKHINCCFMIESDNVTDNLLFAVNSLITLYQIRHFYLGHSFTLRSPNQRANQICRSYKNEEFDWLFDFVTVTWKNNLYLLAEWRSRVPIKMFQIKMSGERSGTDWSTATEGKALFFNKSTFYNT